MGRQNIVAGHVFMALDKARIAYLLSAAARSQLFLFIGISLAECALLAALFRFLAFPRRESRPSIMKLRVCFMLPLLAGQVLFLLLLHTPLSNLYQAEMEHTGNQLARRMTWDLERLAGMGLPVSALHGMED